MRHHTAQENSQGNLESLLARGKAPEALEWAKKQSPLNASDAERLLASARGWHAQGFLLEQQEACRLVLAALPEHYEALHLLGFGAQMRGETGEAEGYYARALAAKPGFAFAKLALAQLKMQRTRFAEGRDDYEARFDAVTEASGPDWRGLPIARWRGESLKGKKVYIWAEQGLGDIVMFASFLPRLMEQSPARVALGMFPKLMTLFARSFPRLDVEPSDDAIHHALGPSVLDTFPHIEKLSQMASVPFSIEPLRAAHNYAQRHGLFDFAAPMGDLMAQFMPDYIPARHPPYLVADSGRVRALREALQGRGRLIGISWHTTNMREPFRNIPLAEWLPVLRTPGRHFVSLQHAADGQEIATFCKQHDVAITVNKDIDFLDDAEGLAALIAAMDEVITIDNSNAHLAGALGMKTTLLLPKGCNYRWPVQEDAGTLWYASVTALRQRIIGDWRETMEAAAEFCKT